MVYEHECKKPKSQACNHWKISRDNKTVVHRCSMQPTGYMGIHFQTSMLANLHKNTPHLLKEVQILSIQYIVHHWQKISYDWLRLLWLTGKNPHLFPHEVKFRTWTAFFIDWFLNLFPFPWNYTIHRSIIDEHRTDGQQWWVWRSELFYSLLFA